MEKSTGLPLPFQVLFGAIPKLVEQLVRRLERPIQVHELENFFINKMFEQLELADGEIVRQFLLAQMQRVLDVEADHAAVGDIAHRMMGEDGKALEYVVVSVVVDHRRVLEQEVSVRRDDDAIMMQSIAVVRVRLTF